MNKPISPAKAFHVARDSAQTLDIGPLQGAVLAIGNFDGVHRGHRAVIGAALKRARALKRKAAALTFAPHPRLFLRPQDPLFQLSSERNKLRLLAATGLDGAVIMTFDASLAATPAADFIERILVGRFGIDFHFGHNRGGSPAYLAEQGQRLGFAVDIVAPLEDEGRPVSSGAVRAALSQGKVVEAAELLGAPWFVSAEVIQGAKRGRELGFPTANLKLDDSCALKHGIYAVRVGIGDMRYDGVANFGRRPTFDNGAPLLEVFLFDFDGDLYGQVIDVALVGWIRHEQMMADAAQARDALKRAGKAFPKLGEFESA